MFSCQPGVERSVTASGLKVGHPAVPALDAQRLVMLQRVCGCVGGTQDLYAEGLEEGLRRVLGASKLFLEKIVDPLRVLSRGSIGDAEEVDQLVREPEAGRGGAEQVEVLAEALPDTPVVRFDGGAVDRWYPQILHLDPLTVQHPEDVMVEDDKQLGWRT